MPAETKFEFKRRHLSGLVRDYILEEIDANPSGTIDQIRQSVSLRLREDFGETPEWLDLLLKLLEMLLPLIFNLRRGRREAPKQPENEQPSTPDAVPDAT